MNRPIARSRIGMTTNREGALSNGRLEALLLEHEVVSQGQLDQVKKQQKSTGEALDTSLIKMGVLTESDLLTALSRLSNRSA